MFLPEAGWRQCLPQARVAKALGVASGTSGRSTSGSCCSLLISSVAGDTTGPLSRLCHPSARRCRHVFLPVSRGTVAAAAASESSSAWSPVRAAVTARPALHGLSAFRVAAHARSAVHPLALPPWDLQSLSYLGPRVILSYPPPTLVTRRAVSRDVHRPLCCPC